MKEKELPNVEMPEKKKPTQKVSMKDMPDVGKPENKVKIGSRIVEIKPTKLKYHRNNVASFYKIIDMIALPDIMAMPSGSFGDERDGDKALMDWLIAVTDDEKLIVDNYDSIDVDTIEKMLEIFKRLNRIDEKEEKQKNAERREKMA